MKTTVKDRIILKTLFEKLVASGDTYICVLCGYTMNIHPERCPKCNSDVED